MISAGVDIAKVDRMIDPIGEKGKAIAKPMSFKNSEVALRDVPPISRGLLCQTMTCSSAWRRVGITGWPASPTLCQRISGP